MNLLNKIIIEWNNSDFNDSGIIKTPDIKNKFNDHFIYRLLPHSKRLALSRKCLQDIRIKSHINKLQILSIHACQMWGFKGTTITINGQIDKIDGDGYTINEYEPGEYEVYIDEFNKQIFTCKHLFYNCIDLISVPLFDTSRVINMNCMFYNCFNLENVPPFDTKNVQDTVDMFGYCENIVSVPEFDMKNLVRGDEMFWSCTKLQTVPLFKNIKKSILKDPEEMGLYKLFWKCHHLDNQTKKVWNPNEIGTPRF